MNGSDIQLRENSHFCVRAVRDKMTLRFSKVKFSESFYHLIPSEIIGNIDKLTISSCINYCNHQLTCVIMSTSSTAFIRKGWEYREGPQKYPFPYRKVAIEGDGDQAQRSFRVAECS